MLEKWTGDAIALMHINQITSKELAEHMGVTKGYLSMLLNGKRKTDDAEKRIFRAIFELTKEA